MSKTKIGSNAIFTGSQQGLTTIGNHCYAYSGATTITSGSYTNVLNFTTGKGYIIADMQITSDETANYDLYYKVEINGVNVMTQFNNNSFQTYPYGFSPIRLLIPPKSAVIVSAQRGSGSDYDIYALIRGEIYG
jgi:hypothetical protein